MTQLTERYPEFQDEESVSLDLVIHDLEQAYSTSMPLQRRAALARALRGPHPVAASSTRRFQKRTSFWPWKGRAATRPAALASVLLVLVLVTGIAYAAVRILGGDQALLAAPDTRAIVQHNLGVPLNVTQRSCGYRVTFNRAYADAHRIVVAYTVTPPHGHTILTHYYPDPDFAFDSVGKPALSPEESNQYQGVTPAGPYGGDPDATTQRFDTGGAASGRLLIFDAGTIHSRPLRSLNLHVVMPIVTAFERLDTSGMVLPVCEQRADGRMAAKGLSGGGPSSFRAIAVNGPFHLDVTVPFYPEAIINLYRTAHVGRTKYTLTREEVTPLDTRVYITTNNLAATTRVVKGSLFPLGLQLQVYARFKEGRTLPFGPWEATVYHGQSAYVFNFTQPYGYHSRWTLYLRGALKGRRLGFNPNIWPAKDTTPLATFTVPLP